MIRCWFPLLATSFLLFVSLPLRGEDAPDKEEVTTYLNQIEATHKQLNDTGRDFGSKLGGAANGGDKEVLALYRVFKDMAKLVFKIQAETRTFTVPDHDLGREVKAANDRFLIYQREVVLSKIPAMIEAAEDTEMQVEAKLEKIRGMIAKDNAREVELGTALKEAIKKLKEAAE